jgi:hypothetical protein
VIREWLLIVWVGTTTNFTLLSWHGSERSCEAARQEIAADFRAPLVVECVTDFREGRSALPSRGYQGGLVK